MQRCCIFEGGQKLFPKNLIVIHTVPKTDVRRPWLMMSVNLGYSFNVHAWLPLCVAMIQHCEELRCSFQQLEGRSLVGYYVALFNVLTCMFT